LVSKLDRCFYFTIEWIRKQDWKCLYI